MAILCHFPLDGKLDNLVEGSPITLTNNGATVSPYGKLGQCYEFNNHTITGNNTMNGKLDNSFTISIWIYVKNTISTHNSFFQFIPAGSSGVSNSFLHLGMPGTRVFRFGFGGNDLDSATACQLNKWTHVAFVLDKTKKERSIFINGVLDKKATYVTDLTIPSNSIITLGKGSSYYMQGMFNDFKIFDHALTPAEVMQLTATRKLISSAGVERIGVNIKKEMEKRGNKPHPLPPGATFAADFRKSLCAWTPNGVMEPLGFKSLYEPESKVYRNSSTDGNKIDIQQTDKGIWIGYGTENLMRRANNHAGCSVTWISENRVKITKTATSTSAYFAFGVNNYTFKGGVRYNLKFKVIEKNLNSNLRIGSATGSVWKEGVYELIAPNINQEYEYFRTAADNISEMTNVRVFHIYPNSGSSTTGDYVIVDIFMEENPLYTPSVKQKRGVSTLCYPYKFTDDNTTTVIKFFGKIYNGPYKGTNVNYQNRVEFLQHNSGQHGYYRTTRSTLNNHLKENDYNVIVIKKEQDSSLISYANGKNIDISFDNRTSWEKTPYTIIGRRSSVGDCTMQNFYSQLFHFNRVLSDDEIYEISNNEIHVPYEELNQKTVNKYNPTENISWNSVRENYNTSIIPSNTTTVMLSPSKTYIVTDSNGNRYKSKVSSTGVVSACTGSTNVLANVAGVINITGNVTFPCHVEII